MFVVYKRGQQMCEWQEVIIRLWFSKRDEENAAAPRVYKWSVVSKRKRENDREEHGIRMQRDKVKE